MLQSLPPVLWLRLELHYRISRIKGGRVGLRKLVTIQPKAKVWELQSNALPHPHLQELVYDSAISSLFFWFNTLCFQYLFSVDMQILGGWKSYSNPFSVKDFSIICPGILSSWWGDGKVLREWATWQVNLIMEHRGHQSTGQCPRRDSPILSGRGAVRRWWRRVRGGGSRMWSEQVGGICYRNTYCLPGDTSPYKGEKLKIIFRFQFNCSVLFPNRSFLNLRYSTCFSSVMYVRIRSVGED